MTEVCVSTFPDWMPELLGWGFGVPQTPGDGSRGEGEVPLSHPSPSSHR